MKSNNQIKFLPHCGDITIENGEFKHALPIN